jgi:hypothetical protein
MKGYVIFNFETCRVVPSATACKGLASEADIHDKKRRRRKKRRHDYNHKDEL